MADNLTRKYLASLNLEQNVIDAIIEAHTGTVDALTTARTELEALRKENATLKTSATDAAAEKARADKAVKDLEDFKALTASNERSAKLEAAYRNLAKAAKIGEKYLDTVTKAAKETGKLNKLTLKDDGTIEDADKVQEAIGTEWPDFVTTSDTKGSNPATPPGGAGSADADLAAFRAAMGLPTNDGGKK